MAAPHLLVLRRSIYLWIGTVLIIAFNLFAASQHQASLTYAALVLTGSMAAFGIGFGIWAARTLTK